MTSTRSSGVKTFVLLFGIVELLGAALWCVAGAGVYGSPLAELDNRERLLILAFLFAGPFSALPAALTALWKPALGAAWFLASGLVSGCLGILFVSTDAGLLPILLASLPLTLLGGWLAFIAASSPEPQGHIPTNSPARHRELGRILLGIILFLVAWFGTFAVWAVLAASNVTGLRGEPVGFGFENDTLADGVILSGMTGIAVLLTLFRKPLRLRPEFWAGVWLALLLAGIVIGFR